MKKVSIIVPVFNTAKYLRQCLDSLVSQSLLELEIIIIDDASSDESLVIAQEYQQMFPEKIIVLSNNINLGIGATRNKGLSQATGDFVGFVDSDDYVDQDMYAAYYDFALQENLDIVTGYYNKIFEDNTSELFLNDYFLPTSFKTNKRLINLIDYGPANKLFRRKILVQNNIQFEESLKYEDMPFVLKATYHAAKIGHIQKAYYNYRVHTNSETTTMDKKVFDMLTILDIIDMYYCDDGPEMEFLYITQLTRYMLQQRNQKDKTIRQKFLDEGYTLLNTRYPNWRNNVYYKKENILKRMIKNNKMFLTFYCNLGR